MIDREVALPLCDRDVRSTWKAPRLARVIMRCGWRLIAAGYAVKVWGLAIEARACRRRGHCRTCKVKAAIGAPGYRAVPTCCVCAAALPGGA